MGSLCLFSEDWQTDFASEEFWNDGEEDGHDEENVGRADLGRSRQFIRPTSDLVHVKPDRKHQRRQTKQNLTATLSVVKRFE